MNYYRIYFELDEIHNKGIIRKTPDSRRHDVKQPGVEIIYSKSFFNPPTEVEGPLLPVVVIDAKQPRVKDFPSPSDILKKSEYSCYLMDHLSSFDIEGPYTTHYLSILKMPNGLELVKEIDWEVLQKSKKTIEIIENIHNKVKENCKDTKVYLGRYPKIKEYPYGNGAGGVVVFAKGNGEIDVPEATFISQETRLFPK